MPIETVPEWMAGLEEEDVAFIRRFVLASGSLKEVAGGYGVTLSHCAPASGPADPEDPSE